MAKTVCSAAIIFLLAIASAVGYFCFRTREIAA